MKRVLITGITGYIGSQLAKRLLPNWEVYGLVRMPLQTQYIASFQDQLTLYPWDGSYASVEEAVKKCSPDLVYHLATFYTGNHRSEDIPAMLQSNLVFGSYLMEAMVSCGCKNIVYASTVMSNYQGESYRPLNLYAATKRAFADIINYYTDAELLCAGTLVLSDTYGPGDQRPKILNLIKEAVRNQTPLKLSDGQQDFDLVYIDDVTSAFELAGEQLMAGIWKNKTFQVCSACPLSLRDTVEKMLEVNQLSFHGAWGERPALKRDMRKVVRVYPMLPGWFPQITLEEGSRLFFS